MTFKTLSVRAHRKESSPGIVPFLQIRQKTWGLGKIRREGQANKGEAVECMENEKPKQMHKRLEHLTFTYSFMLSLSKFEKNIKMKKSVVPRPMVLKRNSLCMLTDSKTHCIGWCNVSQKKVRKGKGFENDNW